MGLSRTWRFLLVAALLLAQHSSLVHQIWHAGGTTAAAAASAPASDSTKGNPLCDQHTALKAVVGALNGCAASPLASEVAATVASAAAIRPPGLAALAPSSRGPPSFS